MKKRNVFISLIMAVCSLGYMDAQIMPWENRTEHDEIMNERECRKGEGKMLLEDIVSGNLIMTKEAVRLTGQKMETIFQGSNLRLRESGKM